jgi:hypothetical protein
MNTELGELALIFQHMDLKDAWRHRERRYEALDARIGDVGNFRQKDRDVEFKTIVHHIFSS